MKMGIFLNRLSVALVFSSLSVSLLAFATTYEPVPIVLALAGAAADFIFTGFTKKLENDPLALLQTYRPFAGLFGIILLLFLGFLALVLMIAAIVLGVETLVQNRGFN